MSEPTREVDAAPPQRDRWWIVAGGVLCLAAMWMPLFNDAFHGGAFIPARDEYGVASWLWLLVPVAALPHTEAGRRVANGLTRAVIVLGGLVGIVALLIFAAWISPISLLFVPAPLAVVVLGAVGRGGARLSASIAIATLVACMLLCDAHARYGLAVLALGAVVLLIGAARWGHRLRLARRAGAVAPVPRAIVR